MYGPSFPRWTWYRLSLNRCGIKRVPSFLPRTTVANSMITPGDVKARVFYKRRAVLVSGLTVENCASFLRGHINGCNLRASTHVFCNRTQLPRGGHSPRRARAGVVSFFGRLPAVGLASSHLTAPSNP